MNISLRSCTLSPCNILVIPVRYRRPNVNKPRKPHYIKQKTLDTCKPSLPKPIDIDFPQYLKCRAAIQEFKLNKVKEMDYNPFEDILARETREQLLKSSMMLALHELPTSGDDRYALEYDLFHIGSVAVRHGKGVIKKALKDTKYISIMAAYKSYTILIAGPSIQLGEALKIIKKHTNLILLFGIVDDKFMSRSEIEKLGKLDLNTARLQLVSTLNFSGTTLVQNMNQHQQILCSYLDQYIQQQQKSGDNEEVTQSDTPAEENK